MIDSDRIIALKIVQKTELMIIMMLGMNKTKLMLEASKVQSEINLFLVNEQ
jgi:hypothetical protein